MVKTTFYKDVIVLKIWHKITVCEHFSNLKYDNEDLMSTIKSSEKTSGSYMIVFGFGQFGLYFDFLFKAMYSGHIT